MTYNAALAGLVGITAGCDAVDAVGAAVIGVVCGILIVLAIEFFDKIAKIDDNGSKPPPSVLGLQSVNKAN